MARPAGQAESGAEEETSRENRWRATTDPRKQSELSVAVISGVNKMPRNLAGWRGPRRSANI
jgi:hypothetical protein